MLKSLGGDFIGRLCQQSGTGYYAKFEELLFLYTFDAYKSDLTRLKLHFILFYVLNIFDRDFVLTSSLLAAA